MTDSWPPWSDDLFLDALRDAYFPGAQKAVVECEGVRVRTLLRGKNAVSGVWQFPIYLEPIRGILEPIVEVPYLADVVVGITTATEPGPPGATVAPFVSWRDFASFEDYLATRVPPPGLDSPSRVAQKARRLRRELGPFELKLIDDDPAVFETLIRWKAAQFRRQGRLSVLSLKQNVDFYWELRRQGIFTATTLKVGDRLLAGEIGYRRGKRHLARLTVYDPSLAHYSPGSIMHLETLRASFEAGDEEFDFLGGGETYKFIYATHARWLGDLGAEPRGIRLRRTVRQRLGRAVAHRRGYTTYKEGVRRASRALRGLLPG